MEGESERIGVQNLASTVHAGQCALPLTSYGPVIELSPGDIRRGQEKGESVAEQKRQYG